MKQNKRRKRWRKNFLRARRARREERLEMERRRAAFEREINARREVEIPAGHTVTINDREFAGPLVVKFPSNPRFIAFNESTEGENESPAHVQ